MNVWDVLVLVAVVAAVVWAVVTMAGNRRRGKRLCGGDCSRCGGCVLCKGGRR